jgi:A/G-specific adenine glycosylase
MRQEQKALLQWYPSNYRDLPWRKTTDPYKIWISEIMLQQTRAAAVIPYYERFLARFPTVKDLAKADLPSVLEMWAGLGYYSRARNIHKAAQVLHKNGFPKTYQELLEITGFGPYTSRAVASFAFSQSAAVLDGNVIRVLSRLREADVDWWTTKGRQHLQDLADQMVEGVDSAPVNQAMMEVGATICLPQNPACLLCPLQKNCVAFHKNLQNQLPRKKPKRAGEIWKVQMYLQSNKNLLAFEKNQSVPFLKGEYLWPLQGEKIKSKPKSYHFKHSVTHHEIYVEILQDRPSTSTKNSLLWIKADEIKKISPFSFTTKAMEYAKTLGLLTSHSTDRLPKRLKKTNHRTRTAKT